MSLNSYLEALTNAPSLEELWDMHCRKMAHYGFDRLLYGFTRYRNGLSLGDPEDFVILTNHPTTYAETFISEGFYFHGPMVRWALDNEGACSWSVVAEMIATGNMSPSEARVIKFNQAHQVTAGYTIGFKSVSPRAKGGIALTARAEMKQAQVDEVWVRHGRDILVMNNVAHLKILTLPYTAPGRSLTRRQREALGWVGDGKTTQDIAVLMGLTPATVEKHLRLAREALNVETTAQAVLKAALQNQMFVLDA